MVARSEWEAKHCSPHDRSSAALYRPFFIVNLLRYLSEKTLLSSLILGGISERHSIEFSRRGAVTPEEDIRTQFEGSNQMVPAKQLREVQTQLAHAERRLSELRAENTSLRVLSIRENELSELIGLGGRFLPSPQD